MKHCDITSSPNLTLRDLEYRAAAHDSAALPRRRRRRRPRCRHRRHSPSCKRPLARHRHTPCAGRARTLTLLPSPSPHHPAFFTALHLASPPPAVPLLSRPLSLQRADDPARPLAIAALAARRITHVRTVRPSSQLLCSQRYPSPTAPADVPIRASVGLRHRHRSRRRPRSCSAPTTPRLRERYGLSVASAALSAPFIPSSACLLLRDLADPQP